ncbi:UDP-glycosyltransferase 91C1-like [Cornus florida]|uniref:UDP-glycosyltransferase 91C1-like n=1 Tax=Cornus florida TaxID=4283 RepID=UPI002897F075|nr:UDP-glycosyltransferase 91C1-like [Cornus florida]
MESGDALHVVMFPWLGMGHFIPFLNLSKCLAQKGHHVSFISTPRNLQRLPKIPPNLAHLITLISLPLPKANHLPDHAESSMDIPHHKQQFLKMAFDLLQPPLTTFLATTTPAPDWIVYDYASPWVPKLAARLGISRAYFSLFTAAAMAYIGPPWALLSDEYARTTPEDFTVVPKWIPFESDMAYRPHEVLKIFESSDEDELVGSQIEAATSDIERFCLSIGESDVVFIRTCVEFEPEWFNLICELYQKPVVPVGVLPPFWDNNETGSDDNKLVGVKEWLDKQIVNSVVYVAFGTESTLSQVELTELALGLEQSRIPFVLVLRNPTGTTLNTIEMLPDGFVERVKSRGVVYVGWAPQAKILGHSAIGGFLTHCGWNSIIEGLGLGRVLILLPLCNEQGLNARLLNNKTLGVEVPRNEQDGSFTRDSVADSVRLAMVKEESEALREKAREMKALFGDKSVNDHYVDGFVRYLVENRTSRLRA